MTARIMVITKIYRSCAVEALRSLIRNWLIIPASVAAYVISGIATGMAVQLGVIGGILAGLLEVLLLAYYYAWLKICNDREKLNTGNIGVLDSEIFSSTLSAAFIIFLALQTVRIMSHGMRPDPLSPLAQLAVFLVFNCLPEVIYVQKDSSLEAFASALRFTRRYWMEWYLPLVLLILPWAWRSFSYALVMFAQSDPLLPVLLPVRGTMSMVPRNLGYQSLALVLIVIASSWYMLFRGNLFNALQDKSNNTRVYRAG